MHIRRLTPDDAAAFQALRLFGLQDTPSAFGSSYEEEQGIALATVAEHLAAKFDRGRFGAFDGDQLIGLAALGRESMRKLSHKTFIWGVYVKPESRGKGVGRALVLEAVALARSVPEVQQINLCVSADNAAAIRLYESIGFIAYGREPGSMFYNGELHDELHMYLRLAKG